MQQAATDLETEASKYQDVSVQLAEAKLQLKADAAVEFKLMGNLAVTCYYLLNYNPDFQLISKAWKDIPNGQMIQKIRIYRVSDGRFC